MDEKYNCGEGYFQPDMPSADFAYWAKIPTWSEREAVSLLLGANPNFTPKHWGQPLPHSLKYKGLLALAIRAADGKAGGLVGWPRTPMRWLAWAKKNDLPMPPELEAEIVKYDRAAVSAERASIAVAEKDNASAETNLEIESKSAVAAPKMLPPMQAKILRIADELWPDKSKIPPRMTERDRAIIAAWKNGETPPHPRTIQRAFAARAIRDKTGQ